MREKLTYFFEGLLWFSLKTVTRTLLSWRSLVPTLLTKLTRQHYGYFLQSFFNLLSFLKTVPKSMVLAPWQQNHLGTLLKVQIPGQPHPFLLQSPWGEAQESPFFRNSLADSPRHSSLRTSGLKHGRYSGNVCRMSCW